MKQAFFIRLAFVVVIAAVICVATVPLQAKERTFTLQEIMAITRESNGELKALREEVGVAEAGKIKAGLYPNPVLDMEGSTGALTGNTLENRTAIGLSQEFLTGGKRDKRLAVAETELIRFGSRIKDAERLLLLEVKTGFYDLLLAERRLELAHKSHGLNNQLLQITKERLTAGDIAELDVNLARVETSRSEERKIEAERELVPSRQRLLSLMGLPMLTDLKIAVSPEIKPFVANLTDLKVLALKNRPDLQTIASEKSKGEAELTLARAEQLPNVTAGVAFSRENSPTTVGDTGDRSIDDLIGLKISVPIPFFDRNQAGLVEAHAKKSSAGIRQTSVRLSIEREVEAAYARLAATEKSANIYGKEILPQLSENLKLVEKAYRSGEVGILVMIEEQKKYIEVNDGYLAALNNRNIAVAKLESAVGIELKNIDGGNK